MEEILDIEELNEEVVDENLKDFMKKDEETEKLLSDKINELASEEDKLTKKEEELKSLEESNREKISTNASADDLIEIAGKIKEVEEELASITENVKNLKKEKEELTKTKVDIEESKKEYIKSLKSASSNYDNQLKKISEAIEVCDNPALKEVLEDVQSKRTNELSEIEEKRISVLRRILKEDEKEEVTQSAELETKDIEIPNIVSEKENNIVEPISTESSSVEKPIQEENVLGDINIEAPSVVIPDELEMPVSASLESSNNDTYTAKTLDDLLLGPSMAVKEEPVNDSNIIGFDSIFGETTNNLNENQKDELIIPDVNQMDNKIKVIYEKDVPSNLLKEIYSSSKIMPSLYNYLESNVLEGSFN